MPNLLDWQYKSDNTWQKALYRAVAYFEAGKTWTTPAASKSLGLLFFNPSLRTRTSMELAGAQLGAHVTTLNVGQGTWGFEWEKGKSMTGNAAEHIKEAAGVLSRYYDALGVRVFASGTDYAKDQQDVLINTFAESASVPVINLESAFYHPCQALADAATLLTHFDGDVKGKRFVLSWAYHPKPLPMAVPNSALLMAARLGMDVTVTHPKGFELDADVMRLASSYAFDAGSAVKTATSQDAYAGADVIYAKAWGGVQRYSNPQREAFSRAKHTEWRVRAECMKNTNNAAFMHCLPVRRNVVVDDAVLDGPQAIHLLQAEMRLHAQKAILEHIWGL